MVISYTHRLGPHMIQQLHRIKTKCHLYLMMDEKQLSNSKPNIIFGTSNKDNPILHFIPQNIHCIMLPRVGNQLLQDYFQSWN